MMEEQSLVERLRKRAEIRRQIPTRKSVQEGMPDRLADLLEEAADEIDKLKAENLSLELRKFVLKDMVKQTSVKHIELKAKWQEAIEAKDAMIESLRSTVKFLARGKG